MGRSGPGRSAEGMEYESIGENMKTLIWKFRYARRMQKRAGVSFSFAWVSAGAALEGFAMDDMTGPEAADEELSYWTNDE